MIDGAKRAELIAQDPKNTEIIKPLAVGDDVRKWHIRDSDKWLIFTRRGIDINQYPAIKNHLEQWRDDLSPKQSSSDAKGRKPGRYKWYEIQDDIAYYQAFEKPKIIYPDIAKESRFAFDAEQHYLGNTIYFIAKNDLFLLAVLNSSIIWTYCKETLTVLGDADKGGRLRFFRQFVEKIPIPPASDRDKAEIENLVGYVLYLTAQLKDIPSYGENLMTVADDKLMLSYFEQIIDVVVMELYLPDELHTHDKYFMRHLMQENLPSLDKVKNDKMPTLRSIFQRLFDREHPIREGIFFLDSVPIVRTIRGLK